MSRMISERGEKLIAESKLRVAELARLYGVSESVIHAIRSKRKKLTKRRDKISSR